MTNDRITESLHFLGVTIRIGAGAVFACTGLGLLLLGGILLSLALQGLEPDSRDGPAHPLSLARFVVLAFAGFGVATIFLWFGIRSLLRIVMNDRRMSAGGVVICTGLALALLAGCFAIGVLDTMDMAWRSGSAESFIAIAILLISTAACLNGAAAILYIGNRETLRILKESTSWHIT